MNTKVDKIVSDRGKSHGDYKLMSELAQILKETIRSWKKGSGINISPYAQESVEMIMLKVARIITGDETFRDHWLDIQGYAKKAEELCCEPEEIMIHNFEEKVTFTARNEIKNDKIKSIREMEAEQQEIYDSSMTLFDLQKRITEWAEKTFPKRTWDNCFKKLFMEELPEILDKRDDPLEYADLFILLIDMAHMKGVNIADAVRRKVEINEAREWDRDPETGLYSHKEEK